MNLSSMQPTPEPTLEIGSLPPFRWEKILVPTDFSKFSLRAVQHGIWLAKEFRSTLTLLHVFQSPDYYYEAAGMGGLNDSYEAASEDARKRLERMQSSIVGQHDVSVRAVLAQGLSYEQIVLVAREIGTDAIVIATHGFTGLQRLIHLGSTAERVVRLAPCPVIVVRGEEYHRWT